MTRDFLFQRRVHISGCAAMDVNVASASNVRSTREFVVALTKELLRKGASFIVPIDRHPTREPDGETFCFDWDILQTLANNLALRPFRSGGESVPLVVAVQHHKNEEQIPLQFRELWEKLKQNSGLVVVENAGHWNMNSKRLELQATHGDVLIALGGDEGVLHLANLYHESGKPVIPLNLPITPENRGSLKLWERALSSSETERFFQTRGGVTAHALINRLNFSSHSSISSRVSALSDVLSHIMPPIAFAVRLLNCEHQQFKHVDDYFTGVIKPVVEDELGFHLVTVDGSDNKEPFINQEIFNRLHRSSVVIVDVTGERPNCFIEMGYALGRGLPTMVCAHQSSELPFDTKPVPTLRWNETDTIEERRRKFRDYWRANANRRRIVEPDPLIR
jgi:hypothetical protein